MVVFVMEFVIEREGWCWMDDRDDGSMAGKM